MELLQTACDKFKQTKFCRTFKEYAGLDDLIAVIITTIGALYYFKNGFLPYNAGWHAFYERIHVELIGIGITVLILGNANQAIRTNQEKHRLILQMGSPDNGFAREAVRQLKTRGWLYDGTLKKADLVGANLDGANLRKANLIEADLLEAHLEGSDLTEARLEGANLLGTYLAGAELTEANLDGADLYHADLNGAHLWRAHLERSRLWGTFLKKSYLDGAYLEGANLQGIFYDANTTWYGARYNKATQWPDGFDPVAARCILVEDE